MEMKEKMLSLNLGNSIDALPGYLTTQDMIRAFNIPVDNEGPVAAVRDWVARHGEYNLAERQPGRWGPV